MKNVPISNYQELRKQIRTGDVMVCKGKSRFSRLISLATASDQTHVAFIEVRSNLNRILVTESVESKGIRTVALKNYLENYDNKGNAYNGEIYILRHRHFATIQKTTPEKVDEIICWAIDRLGHPYSKRQIMKICYSLLLKKPITKLVADKRTEWICSVFVADLFSKIDIIIPFDNGGYIKPADFKIGENFKLIGRLK